MKKYFYSITFLFLTLNSFAQKKTFPTEEVKAIKVLGNFDVVLTSGNETSLAIKKGEIVSEKITYIIADSILYIGTAKVHKRQRGKLSISSPCFKNFSFQGKGSLVCKNINTSDTSSWVLKGHVKATLDFESKHTSIHMTQSTFCSLSGKANRLSIKTNGSSVFKGYNFNADTSSLNITGNSICELNASKQINGEIRAAGKAWFKGNPKIKVKTFDQALIGNQTQRPKE